MKKLHLLCNAHLDPAWLWRWNEGLAEAISTFRVAADFCEEYEGFVFNHNEALLYEWVEEHEPALFARIQKLVAAGKWKIMGGWYLQSDCVLTSGESLLEQIRLGRTYFQEKFGVTPTTAINFDPFGHSRGLVQILTACGYDSYIFMRPHEFRGDFWWEGFDGSRVLAHGINGGYNTLKGKALNKIQSTIAENRKEIDLCLWGIGDHGGGPSRVDLEAIQAFLAETDLDVRHSCAEDYMKEVDRTDLPVRRESLIPAMVGCYTSMVRIKQANRRLENKLAATEKVMSYAAMTTGFTPDTTELNKAKKALAFCQFHDILPGSGVKAVEEDSLRTFGYGEEIADRLYMKAFFALCQGQKKARDGEIPILICNPHPYPIETDFEVGFMLEDQNWNENDQTLATVYDCDGNPLPTQNEKPACTFNLDWIQKVSFRAKIAPASVSRFDCKLRVVSKDTLPPLPTDSIEVHNEHMDLVIDRATGLIRLYRVDGKTLLENSGVLEVCRDNEDPWGMTVDRFTDTLDTFRLMTKAEANAFTGYPDAEEEAVRVVEDGPVRMKVQAFFCWASNKALVEYTIPKQDSYVDIAITLLSCEPNKMIKYALHSAIQGTPMGQTAFGSQSLYDDLRESVFHKWCGLCGSEGNVYVVNDGTYGGSFTKDTMKLSLLRTPVYSAHPIGSRPIAPHNRALEHIDMGERSFHLRITADENIDRHAQVFNEAPTVLSFFPAGDGQPLPNAMTVQGEGVQVSSLKSTPGGYLLTLYNTGCTDTCAHIRLHDGRELTLPLAPYQLKQTVL